MKHYYVNYCIEVNGFEFGDNFLLDATDKKDAQALADRYVDNLASSMGTGTVGTIREVDDVEDWATLKKFLSYAITWADVADQEDDTEPVGALQLV